MVNEPSPHRDRYDFASDPDGVTLDDTLPADDFLEKVLAIVFGPDDTNHGAIGLTLATEGVIVVGIAISEDEWAQGVISTLTQASEPMGTLLTTFHEKNQDNRVEVRKRRGAESRPMPAREFIHMKDVVLHGGAGEVRRAFWRIPVSAVTGWSTETYALPKKDE